MANVRQFRFGASGSRATPILVVTVFSLVIAAAPWVEYLEIASDEHYHGVEEVQNVRDSCVLVSTVSLAFAVGSAALFFVTRRHENGVKPHRNQDRANS